MTLLATLITPPFGGGPAEGVVAWPEVTVLAFWFLLMALVGSLLGILHERARAVPGGADNGAKHAGDDTDVLADRRVDHAA